MPESVDNDALKELYSLNPFSEDWLIDPRGEVSTEMMRKAIYVTAHIVDNASIELILLTFKYTEQSITMVRLGNYQSVFGIKTQGFESMYITSDKRVLIQSEATLKEYTIDTSLVLRAVDQITRDIFHILA